MTNQTIRYSILFQSISPCWCVLTGTDACCDCEFKKGLKHKHVFKRNISSFNN